MWGVNKFTKKLREADPIPTNEIDNLVRLDFECSDLTLLLNLSHNQRHFFQLSRVPDHEMVEDCRDPTTSPASPPSSPTL